MVRKDVSSLEATKKKKALVPTIQKLEQSKSGHLSGFQMVIDKVAAICPDFKWMGFRISDPIQNLDHLQPNLFLTIQNPD